MRFGKDWFRKHQSHLLRFVNTRLGRWFFRIPENDVPFRTKIMEFMPNRVSHSYKIVGNRLEKTTEFLTSDKYQFRLNTVYERAAKILPISAGAIAHLMEPNHSFGFIPLLALSTLTKYSTSGSSSPVDGYVDRNGVSENWATIHDAANGNDSNRDSATQTNSVGLTIAYNGSGFLTTLGRIHTFFDTSSLTSSAVISAATYSLYGVDGPTESLTGQKLVVVASSAASASTIAATTDYSTLGTTAFCTAVAITGWTSGAYNAYTLNASGLAGISKTAITKFGVRYESDQTNTDPAGSAFNKAQVNCYFADFGGDTNAPKLVVTYTVPQILNLSETPGITERFSRAWTAPRSQSESIGLQSESLNRTANYPRALGTETVSITETFSKLKARVLDILESIPVGDTLSRVYSAVRSPLDSVGITDAFSRAWSLARTLSTESLSITEIFVIGKVAIRSLSESLGITESFSRTVNYARTLSDAPSITETLTKIKQRVLDLLESIGITENSVNVTRNVVFFNRVLNEQLSITEFFATPLNWIKRTRPTATWTKRNRP